MSRAVQASAGSTWRSVEGPIDLAALHAANPGRYPHLLESAAHGTPPGRFDILFAFPGRALVLDAEGMLHDGGRALPGGDFLSALDRAFQTERIDPEEAPLPFRGGWFLFLSYELIAQIEPRFAALPREARLPVAQATRFPAAVVRDRRGERTYLVGERGQEDLLDAMRQDIDRLAPVDATAELGVATLEEDPGPEYLAQVHRIKDYVAAGDVFQVNLSRGWRATLARPVAPVAVYRRLRTANPAPFSGIMTLPGGAILSSSPERLVEVRGRTVRTRPIAGTYPRGEDRDEDARRARELLAHPKERAEHVMLIDLERNDLGRVCRPGSVRVSELMALESYRHVHHIVSEVRGELRTDVTPAGAIRAVFPGGTITGCPKVRCMEIIAELERAPRGAYTGSMGYLNRDGSLDLNILIRTLVQIDTQIRFRAGAGIVADSVPERELSETRAKAKGLLRALGLP